jgi:hypothetical protein
MLSALRASRATQAELKAAIALAPEAIAIKPAGSIQEHSTEDV